MTLGRSKPNTCDKAGIVGHPQPPPLMMCYWSLDNVWTLIELLSNVFMLGLRLTGSDGEPPRVPLQLARNYLDKNYYKLGNVEFFILLRREIVRGQVVKVYILLKMNVIKLSLHQIGLRVTGARTSGDSDGFTSSRDLSWYQLYFHTAQNKINFTWFFCNINPMRHSVCVQFAVVYSPELIE